MSEFNNPAVSRRSFLTGDWSTQSGISNACLNNMGVYCQSCKDACSENAIKFSQIKAGLQIPAIITEYCTHCRECVDGCPVDAITISPIKGDLNA
jgi:ferredoxin-type protein NapF